MTSTETPPEMLYVLIGLNLESELLCIEIMYGKLIFQGSSRWATVHLCCGRRGLSPAALIYEGCGTDQAQFYIHLHQLYHHNRQRRTVHGCGAREHTSTYAVTFSAESCMIEATQFALSTAHGGEVCTGSLLIDLHHRAQFECFLVFEVSR